MKPAGWLVFREIYLKIILSILAVVAVMLLLQNALNQLKLRSLAAEATSSRLQISAATIESAIVRAEGLGLAMDEMDGLSDLLNRERARFENVAQIAVVSPIGVPVAVSGGVSLPAAESEQMMRRVLGGRDKVSLYDAGERLHTGRVLYDSGNAMMGAVILTTPTAKYLTRARQSFASMTSSSLLIFACVAAVLIPFILFQFAGVSRAFRAFDPVRAGGDDAGNTPTNDALGAQAAIAAGNRKFADIEQELDTLLSEAADGAPRTKEAAT